MYDVLLNKTTERSGNSPDKSIFYIYLSLPGSLLSCALALSCGVLSTLHFLYIALYFLFSLRLWLCTCRLAP